MRTSRAFASPPPLPRNRRTNWRPAKGDSRPVARDSRTSWRRAAAKVLSLGAATAGLTSGAAAEAAQEIVKMDSVDFQCRMVVLDNFKTGEKSHGHKVGLAAESVGVENDIIDVQLDTGKLRLQRIRESTPDNMVMSDTSKSVEEISSAFDRLVATKFTTQLDILTEDLGALTEAGYSQSTANVSQGLDEAGVVTEFYKSATLARRTDKENVKELGLRRAQNFAKLFDLDHTKFLSEDPTVAGPELQKLQQAIIDRVHEVASTNDDVASSRQTWRDTVNQFEENHNSVVVAAGNSGSKGRALVGANGGHELSFPATFYNNSLGIDEVTLVGAITPVHLEGRDQAIEIVATYNSPSQGIDIYANGNVSYPGGSAQGTSFASPKVSAAMTEAHCENPELSSQEVEAHIADHRSRDLTPYGKGLTVLDTAY